LAVVAVVVGKGVCSEDPYLGGREAAKIVSSSM
jgi:hypothetical protein